MIEPQTVKKILDSPEGQELIAYLGEVLEELNNISDIDIVSNYEKEIAIEVTARKRAYEKLKKILQPFLSLSRNAIIEGKGSEYIT